MFIFVELNKMRFILLVLKVERGKLKKVVLKFCLLFVLNLFSCIEFMERICIVKVIILFLR